MTSYDRMLAQRVRAKWPTGDQQEWWYTKHNMAKRSKLERLYKSQEGRCHYCGRETWLKEAGVNEMPGGASYRRMATLEHIKPQSEGGTFWMGNLVMACGACNQRRGTLPYEYFVGLIQDPEKMRAHNRQQGIQLRENAAKRKSRSGDRKARLVWNLAILFYLWKTWPSGNQG